MMRFRKLPAILRALKPNPSTSLKKYVIKQPFSLLAGNPQHLSLEHRLFNLMLLLAVTIAILGAYHNYLLGLPDITIYPSLCGGFVGGLFFYISRIKKIYHDPFVYVLALLTMVILSIVFFFNSGSAGPIIILDVCLFMIFILISNGITQYIILLLLLGHVFLLYFLEYQHPEWMHYYQNPRERLIDVMVTFGYSTFFMTFATILFKKNYNLERVRTATQNAELERLNARVTEQNARLEASLVKENEKNEFISQLMRELNHRVKNNLQLITSLLNTQAAQLSDAEARNHLELARNRIVSIGLIHQKLYRDQKALTLDLAEYIVDLSRYLIESSGDSGSIGLSSELTALQTRLEVAVHIGLVVNELITNSIKHAWKSSDKDKRISLRSEYQPEEHCYHLIVADNGKGFDSGMMQNSDSFGLELVASIVDQYDGQLDIESSAGTTVHMQYYFDPERSS